MLQMKEIGPTRIVDREWGKAGVKLLYVSKKDLVHSIKELEVKTALSLETEKDYRSGDNKDIIATDSQKNTVNVFAKQYGVQNAESFALKLAEHFLVQYQKVNRTNIKIDEKPWQRMQDVQGRQHNHAFQCVPKSTRYAEVEMDRNGKICVCAGIRDLVILKTTQSGFSDFVRDEYTTLSDCDDRICSTSVTADWTYSDVNNLDFDFTWRTIQDIILAQFAGPVDTGIYSDSVQHTQHLMQKAILDAFPQVDSVTIEMPNRHYFSVDFTRFPIQEVQGAGAGEVFLPVDKPYGFIQSTLKRE